MTFPQGKFDSTNAIFSGTPCVAATADRYTTDRRVIFSLHFSPLVTALVVRTLIDHCAHVYICDLCARACVWVCSDGECVNGRTFTKYCFCLKGYRTDTNKSHDVRIKGMRGFNEDFFFFFILFKKIIFTINII